MRNMLGALPILTCLLWAAAIRVRLARDSGTAPLRQSLLSAVVLSAAWLVLGTELLSPARSISFWPVALWWLAPAAATATALYRRRAQLREIEVPLPRLDCGQAVLAVAVGVLLALALGQACFSPPNSSDAISYHLQRQVFWLQQGSVAHYATGILRQLTMPPLSEFAGLHLMVLVGGDRWHNCVQWAALVLTTLAASLIVRRLRGSVTAQLACALMIVAAPASFLEASSVNNDALVGLFACLAAAWTLELDGREPWRWRRPALIGLAFGAMALTKGTGVLFGFPIGVYCFWLLFRRHRAQALQSMLLIVALALAMNVGHFSRNIAAFGSIAPDLSALDALSPLEKIGNELRTPSGVASNMVRTLAVNCAAPSRAVDDFVTDGVLAFHRRLGLGVNDLRTTVSQGLFHPLIFPIQKNEDTAGFPFHTLLLLSLPLALFTARRDLPKNGIGTLLAFFFATFFLICVYLKWSRFSSRFFVAGIPLLAPVFAVVWTSPRLIRLFPIVVAGLVLTLLPSFAAVQRPLFGPHSVFREGPDVVRCNAAPSIYEPTKALAELLVRLRPSNVGFITGPPDYVIERLLLDRLAAPPRFAAFNAIYQPPGYREPDPDVLLATSREPRIRHQSTGTWYALQTLALPYALYFPEKRRILIK